jgi:Na+-driven multidrug efflux pump
MVAISFGAGDIRRAARIAWAGSLIGAAVTGVLGICGLLFRYEFLRLFSNDVEVVRVGADYLGGVGVIFGFYGLAFVAYFAGQGSGRIRLPVLAGTGRLVVAAVGGWIYVSMGANITELFYLISAAYVFAGIICILFLIRLGRASIPAIQNNPAKPALRQVG